MNAPHAPAPNELATPDLFTFDNSYARELDDYCVRWSPAPASRPVLLQLNRELAAELGADPQALAAPDGVAALAGNRVPAGAEPVAQAYAGHQFGGFSPQLGDGRALLLGEVVDRNGRRRDIAFKGSGRTPFSRNGDGKCALGPALREYLIGEAMHALGIPTTRALAVVATGDMVRRDRALPGAVLTRVAASHIRVGTFEYFAAHHGPERVKRLADYTIARHYPQLAASATPYLDLLAAVAERQAELVARWLGVGFIHGVMNTDNMTLSGETIDYGPCAFMETYSPHTVFSSIDSAGRYAYGKQAGIARWNLARLAETLLPLIDADSPRAVTLATEVIDAFPERHAAHWLRVFRAKLGLDEQADAAVDQALIDDFLLLIKGLRLDFTQSFRALYDARLADAADQLPARLLALAGDAVRSDDDGADLVAWSARWQARQPQCAPALLAAMRLANPCYIARNHQVEAALDAAVEHNDLAPFERLLEVLRAPFDARPADAAYGEPATREFTTCYQTFCGT
ncbi:YdiU family protein [Azonexus sp. R2A61]|uniref:protein adenylyltransferase SelO n=1 Tax=Azonexus sp. R2A61 TaxID=2744443 RepID=UPI001F25DD32|nr:YdiU family protein [Azonexus sp. R2A61]